MKAGKRFIYTILICICTLMLCACASGKEGNQTKQDSEPSTVEELLDCIIEVEENRDVKVLQLTDTEIIDSMQKRTSDRLVGLQYTMWLPQNMEMKCFQYIREAIERVEPDFIIITGDVIYGEFDDNGTSMEAFIEFMESFKIPWAPVFGDLDNQSAKGANWQCDVLEAAKYCCFKRGDTDGNGNYSVGIRQGSELVRVFYMMDSNTCNRAYEPEKNHVTTSLGFTPGQGEWLYNRLSRMEELLEGKEVKSSLCFHLPTDDVRIVNEKYSSKRIPFTINENVKGDEGDFGSMEEEFAATIPSPVIAGKTFINLLKEFHVDSVFMGHYHKISTSVMYEGIRWTFGLKSSAYESYIEERLGGTQITFNKDELTTKHVYYDETYEKYLDELDYY